MSQNDPSTLFSLPGLDTLIEGVCLIGSDGRVVYANAVAARHSHRSVEELVGAHLDVEATPIHAAIRRCLEDGAAGPLEIEIPAPDGTTAWLELQLRRVPAGVVVLSIDVTARRRAEQALRRAERALAAVSTCHQALLGAPDEAALLQRVCDVAVEAGYRMAWIGIAEHDERRTVRLAASAGQDAWIRGPHVSWDDVPTGRGPIGRAIRTGEPAISRSIATDPGFAPWRDAALEGGVRSAVAVPFRIGAVVAGAVGFYTAELDAFDADEVRLLTTLALDVGYGLEALHTREAQHAAEAALRESQESYRALVENLEDVVFSLDGEGRLQYISGAISRYGYTPAELIGQSFARFVHEDDLDGLLQSFGRTVSGQLEPYLFRARDVRGAVRHVRTSSRPNVRDGRLIGINGVLIDVTEQRQTEEQLRAAQKMEAVGRLAGGIAHDFNNLLAAILSYAEFAREALQPGDPLRDDVEEIYRAGERAATLTRQLLAFSRRQVLEPRVLDLNQVTRDLERMLQRLIGADIELVLTLAPDLGHVRADPGQIEQVIMNLVVNARDAMPRGGRLLIETADVELDAEYTARHVAVAPGPYVQVTITDTGCGMDPATLERLFEPFFTTKEQGKGTGLGLCTAYGIIKQSGGDIWAYSEPGLGTTFKVYLPRVVDLLEAGSAVAPDPSARGSETILVVEDAAPVRHLTIRILRARGFDVLDAASGREAIERCRDHAGEIHLLLTDVVMPLMNGRELARELEAIRPGLRVLYMSGYPEGAISSGVLDPGTRLLSKPFTAAQLARKVRDALDDPGPRAIR